MARRLAPLDRAGNRSLKATGILQWIHEDADDWQLGAAGSTIIAQSESIAWYYQRRYEGHSVTRKDDHWLLVVRASDRTGHWVAFFSGVNQNQAFAAFAWAVANDLIDWKPDKFRN